MSKWISVDEILPDSDDDFLVVVGSDVFTCTFNPWTSDPSKNLEYSYPWFSLQDVPNWGSERREVCGVSHWMPLPEPPEGN